MMVLDDNSKSLIISINLCNIPNMIIPTGNQKIPYHVVFDGQYDLRHKAIKNAGEIWTKFFTIVLK
jgi:hypothetical protein